MCLCVFDYIPFQSNRNILDILFYSLCTTFNSNLAIHKHRPLHIYIYCSDLCDVVSTGIESEL